MRSYIYKIIIAAIALIIVFEFTIGRKLNKADELSNKFLTKIGRKELINSLKIEMAKATERENYLTEEEIVLIDKFVRKIKKELNSVENN